MGETEIEDPTRDSFIQMSKRIAVIQSGSAYLSDFHRAEELFRTAAGALENGDVIIDFDGVKSATPSWLFNFLGNLVMNFPKLFDEHVRIENVAPLLKSQVDFAINEGRHRAQH